MALSRSACSSALQKELDTADIAREAIYQQLVISHHVAWQDIRMDLMWTLGELVGLLEPPESLAV